MTVWNATLVLPPLDLNWNINFSGVSSLLAIELKLIPLALLVFQLADCRSWDVSVFTIAWPNSLLFLSVYVYILLVLFLKEPLFINIYLFIAYDFDAVSKKAFLNLRSWRFIPVLSFKTFIVLAFTFRTGVRFELIFVYEVRNSSNFILLPVAIQLYLNHLFIRLLAACWTVLAPLSKVNWT